MVIDEYIDFDRETGISTDIKNVDGKVLDEIEIYGTTYNFAEEKSTKQVSSEYTQVEYIQGNENQYISSGIIPNDTTEIESNVDLTIDSSGNIYFISNEQVEYIKVYNNNVLVRDLIPCYRKDNGLIGFYDLIELGFHTNMGSGTFTKGLDSQNICRNAVNEPIIDLNISGNSVQDGNIFNKETMSERIYAYVAGDGKWKYSNDSYSVRVPAKPNTTYIITTENEVTIFRAGCLETDDIPIEGVGVDIYNVVLNTDNTPITITTTANTKYIFIQSTAALMSTTLETLKVEQQLTPETPIEIESVGEKTNNLFSYDTLLENDYIELINKSTGEFYIKNPYGIPNIYINAKENTVYNISYKVKVVTQQAIILTIYYTDGTYKNVSENNTIVGEYVEVSGVSLENKTIDYVKLGGGGGIYINTYFKEVQIKENNTVNEYEPYGYKVPVNVKVNLYNPNTIVNGKYINSRGDDVETTQLFRTDYFSVLANEEYLLKFSATRTNIVAFAWYDTNKTFISRSSSEQITGEIEFKAVAPSNAVYAICNIMQDSTNISITGIGETTNIYLNEPLRRIGDYADYIDYKNKKIVRKIAKKIFDGTEEINSLTINPYSYNYYSLGISGLVINDVCLCTHLELQTNFSYLIEGNNKFRVLNSSANNQSRIVFRFYINNSIVTDVNEVKTLLTEYYNSGNPMIVYYAHPEELDVEENISIDDIYTQDGTNIFNIETTIQPSDMFLEYWKQIFGENKIL